MIRKILSVVVLIFLITGITFAFQNEPDGFRGLKWGDAPTEDMTFLGEVTEYVIDNYPKTTITNTKTNSYYKRNEKINMEKQRDGSLFYKNNYK